MNDKTYKVKIRLTDSGVEFERNVAARSRQDAQRKVKAYPYVYLTEADVVLADSVAANLAEVI